MEFFSANGEKRPVRLSEATRKFAADSLSHKYGSDAVKHFDIPIDDIEGFSDMDLYEQYDAAVAAVAERAPVRICEGELISGSANIGAAIGARLPATYKGNPLFWGVSHLTADFESVVKYGTDAIREKALASYEKYRGTEKEEFSESCLHVLDALDLWHARYLEALKEKGYTENYENLKNVPRKGARNFYEAVQSVWFVFAFIRLTGNWPGIGRVDKMWGPFLKKDLESGAITLEKAREIIAHFFIKGNEWNCGSAYEGIFNGSGDAQHYQNLVLAGIDENGDDITNEVTYLILDVIEELGISDYPTTVRLGKNSDERLIRRVAEVIRYGGGILAVYNEDLIIESMVEYGYPLSEARNFANDGCWEVQVPGKTWFGYLSNDFLQILQKDTLKNYDGSVEFSDFDGLFEAYMREVAVKLEELYSVWGVRKPESERMIFKDGKWRWTDTAPTTVVSLFEGDCVERGESYWDFGTVYTVISPHIGGLADSVNSLYAIKKLVFDEKKLSFKELMSILSANWEGNEALRQYVMNKYVYYGNDNDEVDAICARLTSRFAELCKSLDGRGKVSFPGGVSTFGRQLGWAKDRLATAFGRKKGEILAANASPTPGTDTKGATAMIRSYCKNDLKKLPVGAALDLKLLPSATKGEEGLDAIVSILKGFVTLGGFFMQPDVADVAVLREAQKHPEDYAGLSVRVSGWNARFVTLNKDWQEMVIRQNECGCR